MGEFSDFIRNASPREREKVMRRVIDQANYDQAMSMLMVAYDEIEQLKGLLQECLDNPGVTIYSAAVEVKIKRVLDRCDQ